MHRFNRTTKWVCQCLCFESDCICGFAATIQSVSQSVGSACCCWEDACGFQSYIQLAAGATWAGGVRHNFACLMTAASSSSSSSSSASSPCLDTPSSPEQLRSRRLLLLHDSSVTRLSFYLGMVRGRAPCTVNTKHRLLIFILLLQICNFFSQSLCNDRPRHPHSLCRFPPCTPSPAGFTPSVHKRPAVLWCHVMKSSE